MKRQLRKIAAPLLVLALTTGAATQAQTLTVLYNFKGTGDGVAPFAGLVMDTAGNLYGTTDDTYSGADCNSSPVYGCGIVFKLDLSGHETILHNFSEGADGSHPQAAVIRDAAGNLYGTTVFGGSGTCPGGCGTLFKLDTSGKLTVLYNAGSDAALIMDAAGNLYGTSGGGPISSNCPGGCGIVFKLDPAGNETVLYSFMGGTDGTNPLAALIMDVAGNLYGTTSGVPSSSCTVACGTAFKLDTSGHETVLHNFTGGSDGASPQAALVMDAAGNLYGTTYKGGGGSNCLGGCGTVFRLDTSGKETVLYSFSGGSDGGYPAAALIIDKAGNLYGTTDTGGTGTCSGFLPPGCGTIFKIDTSGKETVLHSFTGSDGEGPIADLIMDATGNFYGTARNTRSTSLFGTVFKLSLSAVAPRKRLVQVTSE